MLTEDGASMIEPGRPAASAVRVERARTATVTARLPLRRDSVGVKRKLLVSRPLRANTAASRGSAAAGVKEPMSPMLSGARFTSRASPGAPIAGAMARPATINAPTPIPDIQRPDNTRDPILD